MRRANLNNVKGQITKRHNSVKEQSENDNSEKGHLSNYTSDKEKSKKGHFWKGQI